MEKKSKKEKVELPNLESGLHKDADNRTFTAKQISCKDGGHVFKHTKKANEVKCDCGVGYVLSDGMELWPDGHIWYEANERVV